MKKSILTACFALFLIVCMAQNNETTCGHVPPDTTTTEFRESEKALIAAMNNPMKSDALINVPVVFHVLHKGEAYGIGSHITEEQVISALVDLNQHFATDYGANVGIEFCMAAVDPDGNATNGIDYVDGCAFPDYCAEGMGIYWNGAGANEYDVKVATGWPNQQYYNIWLVWAIDNNFGLGGIQGYAYLPTTSLVDGIVQLSNATGTVGNLKSYTNLNKTLVHEMGHAFSLWHTFQGQSCAAESNCALAGDRVCDTAPQTQATSCTVGTCGFVSENHLDYLRQDCRNLFTEGQKTRMRASATVSRANLIASNKCEPLAPASSIAITRYGALCVSPGVMKVGFRVAHETGIDYFVVHNGVDSASLAALDTLQSLGDTDVPHNYIYTHHFTSAANYWQLEWVDVYGVSTRSDVLYRACLVSPGAAHVTGIWDLTGNPIETPLSRGIYIVGYSDGTYKKYISQ